MQIFIFSYTFLETSVKIWGGCMEREKIEIIPIMIMFWDRYHAFMTIVFIIIVIILIIKIDK